MNIDDLRENTDYKRALQITEAIDGPTIGLASPTEPKTTFDIQKVLIKQNNTLISLIVNLTLQVQRLQEEIRQVSLPKPRTASKELEDSIADLTRRIGSLNLGTDPIIPKKKGSILVFKNPAEILKNEVNPEAQLEISRTQRAGMVPAEVLYSTSHRPTQHRVYQHYLEEDVQCIENNEIDLPLVTEQSHQTLRESGFQHIHIGLIMVRVYTLHRRDTGVMALAVLRDTRWRDDRSIIATMEMDLTRGTQMVYVIPDIMMSIEDFANHLELSLQTQGYTPVSEQLSYQVNQNDEEICSSEREILAYLFEEEPLILKVKKLHPAAVIPQRKTMGAAGYDLAIIQTYELHSGERMLLSTGIAVAIPEGHYGRIAARSGIAWKQGVQIGAGVIDQDYRGEVKILVFNLNFDTILLVKGEAVAQLIIEKICVPQVIQVEDLEETSRGVMGFGSTNQRDGVPEESKQQGKQIQETHIFEILLPREKQQEYWSLTLHKDHPSGGMEEENEEKNYSTDDFYSADDFYPPEEYMAMLQTEAELDYPMQRPNNESLLASTSAISTYNPPTDAVMGPPQFAPATIKIEPPNVSKLGPLYEKTSPHGDKRMKTLDWALIKEIKAQVNNLPDLEIPPENAYIVMETDGSMMGWGGVYKWKPSKYDPRNTERIYAYAHGKFPVIKSVIDAEIYVAMETMTALKIHYMDKREITLRTDCQSIIKPETLAVIITEDGEIASGPPTLTDAEEEAACSSRFPLLTEYEDLISETHSKNFLKEEHEKRNRMAKIEDEAIGNVMICFRLFLPVKEVKLLCTLKETGLFQFIKARKPRISMHNIWQCTHLATNKGFATKNLQHSCSS
ncbi:hypothetical protein ZIOFF_009789 [Zingiber officinale]|uniref:dUTP diphosphatase n=1 Tax=Zingiber officinale TaxID=94328 RepID=A0A8J5HNL0_ZINOF|nr:hypothetical protein ZIOFF_009789 [Zingiber officinale]